MGNFWVRKGGNWKNVTIDMVWGTWIKNPWKNYDLPQIDFIKKFRSLFFKFRHMRSFVCKTMQWITFSLGMTSSLAIWALRTFTPTTTSSSYVFTSFSSIRVCHCRHFNNFSLIIIFLQIRNQICLLIKQSIEGIWLPARIWSRTWSKSECKLLKIKNHIISIKFLVEFL